MIHYTRGMVVIGSLNKVIQSMYQWYDVKNVFLLSISCQTLKVFTEYRVDTFNDYKSSDKRQILSTSWKKIINK